MQIHILVYYPYIMSQTLLIWKATNSMVSKYLVKNIFSLYRGKMALRLYACFKNVECLTIHSTHLQTNVTLFLILVSPLVLHVEVISVCFVSVCSGQAHVWRPPAQHHRSLTVEVAMNNGLFFGLACLWLVWFVSIPKTKVCVPYQKLRQNAWYQNKGLWVKCLPAVLYFSEWAVKTSNTMCSCSVWHSSAYNWVHFMVWFKLLFCRRMTMHPKVQVTLRDRRGLADILIIGGGRGGDTLRHSSPNK